MGVVNVRYYATGRPNGGGGGGGGNKKNKNKKPPPALDNSLRYRPDWIPHPRASFRDGTGLRLDLPFAPTGGEFSGFARKWIEIERPLRPNILMDSGPGLRVNAYTLTVARPDGGSVAMELAALQIMASRSKHDKASIAVLGLSGMEGGPWRITELVVKVQRRQHGTNDPTFAEVDITFAEVGLLNMGIARTKKKGK